MAQPVEFSTQITLSTDEIFDVVASCDEVVGHADDVGEMSIAFTSMRPAGSCSAA